VPDFVSASLGKIVRLRRRLASAGAALRGLFGASEQQDEALQKLESLQVPPPLRFSWSGRARRRMPTLILRSASGACWSAVSADRPTMLGRRHLRSKCYHPAPIVCLFALMCAQGVSC